jgi:hypothetical protein
MQSCLPLTHRPLSACLMQLCAAAATAPAEALHTRAAERVVEVRIQQHGLGAGCRRFGRNDDHDIADILVRIRNQLVDEHHVDRASGSLPVHLHKQQYENHFKHIGFCALLGQS